MTVNERKLDESLKMLRSRYNNQKEEERKSETVLNKLMQFREISVQIEKSRRQTTNNFIQCEEIWNEIEDKGKE